jgi:tetratricopeptide (TPR) repeat protein
MAFDPYQPCPCGSGKKFKWCCQPIYGPIDKAFQQDAEGQHDAALRMMEEVCAQHPANPEVWGRMAQLLYQMNRVDDAENALQKAFDINPLYPFGLYLRGRFRHFEGEIPGAILLFRKAAEAYDPAAHGVLAQIYSLIAECELKLNRPVAARAALEMAIKHDPASPEFKAAVEQVFGAESKFPEAARKSYAYRQLPADASPGLKATWQQTLQTAATGKLSDAVKAWEQLTAANGDDPAAWFNLGLTKGWFGDNSGAVAAFERSVELEKDDALATQTWALAEVLLCGSGMEEQANFVEHTATFPIRNPQQLVQILQNLQQERRLIGTQVRQEDGILTGILVEKVQAFTPEHAASQLPRLGAYVMVVGDALRMWNANKETFDLVVNEMRQLGAGILGDPYIVVNAAHFADVLAEAMAFPVHATEEADGTRRMREFFQRTLEEKWIHKPLRSLGMVPPVDAAGHKTPRKKLRGIIQFLADCATAIGSVYDFDRLRRKLGLLGDVASVTAAPARDFSAMSAAELAGMDSGALSDAELEDAYQNALKLGANDLAGKFAKALVSRPPRPDKPDRYPLYNQLVQQALAEGQTGAALELINEGEKADSEHNEGRRHNDYELRRGQVHLKGSQIDQAMAAFERLIEQAPGELRYRGSAAEAMLSAKQPTKALQFAEGGLKKSREQNNRDSEQYFLELTAAARKQGA